MIIDAIVKPLLLLYSYLKLGPTLPLLARVANILMSLQLTHLHHVDDLREAILALDSVLPGAAGR